MKSGPSPEPGGKTIEVETGVSFIAQERMLKWFECAHLPEPLKAISQRFRDLAILLCDVIEPGPERTISLRKLLEAKDAAVRAKLHPGG